MHLCLHLPSTHSTIGIRKTFWSPSRKSFQQSYQSWTFFRRIVQLEWMLMNFQVSSCFLLPQVGGRHARTSLRARGGEQVDVKAWLAFQSRPCSHWWLEMNGYPYRNVPNHYDLSNLLLLFFLDLGWSILFVLHNMDNVNNCNRFLLGHGIMHS